MVVTFILIAVAFQVLLVFVHLAVYGAVNAAFGIDGPTLRCIFVILALTFSSSSLIAHWYKGKWIDWYYTAAAYWFGLVHFLFGGAVAFVFAAQVIYSFNYYVSPAVLGGIVFSLFFLIHLYGTWLSGRVVVRKIEVALPSLPAVWRGKKIVFVSDLHLGNVRRAGFTAKVVKKIQELQADTIFIGGDLYDGSACDPAKLIEPLRALRAPHGVYFVTGNHDHFLKNLEEAFAAIRGVGIRILNNETVDINGIQFLGVDDKATHRKADYEAVLRKIGRGAAPTILIKHEPNHMEVSRAAGISFGLFGHTHHGQIFPLNFFTRQIYKGFDYGLGWLGEMQIYTSSGVGTWGPPLRLGTKSEIVLITLSRPASSGSGKA